MFCFIGFNYAVNLYGVYYIIYGFVEIVDRKEKCTKLMEIIINLTVAKLGLSGQEAESFRSFPDFKLIGEVVETTLFIACPGFDFPSL